MADSMPAPKGGLPSPDDKRPDFQLYRGGDGGGGGPPISLPMILVLVVVLAGGYWVAMQMVKKETPAGHEDLPPEAPAPTPKKTVDIPAGLQEKLDYNEEQEDYEEFVRYAEDEVLPEHPNTALRKKVAELRKKLKLEKPVAELVREAELLARSKRYDEAIKVADKAIERDSENAFAHFWRGFSRGRVGQKGLATADLKAAIELKFPHKAVAEKLIKRWEK